MSLGLDLQIKAIINYWYYYYYFGITKTDIIFIRSFMLIQTILLILSLKLGNVGCFSIENFSKRWNQGNSDQSPQAMLH